MVLGEPWITRASTAGVKAVCLVASTIETEDAAERRARLEVWWGADSFAGALLKKFVRYITLGSHTMWLLKRSYDIGFDIHRVHFPAKHVTSLAVCVAESTPFTKIGLFTLLLLQIFFPSYASMYCVDFFIFF